MENKKKHTGTLLVTIGCIIAAIIAGVGISFLVVQEYSHSHEVKSIQKYCALTENETDVLFTISDTPAVRFDVNAYRLFENTCLGNASANLLAYGSYCEKDDTVCESVEKTVLHKDNEDVVLYDGPSSYINIMDGYVYYRPDDNRQVYQYTISSGKTDCIIDTSCSEMVVSTKGISYIDYGSVQLKFYSLENQKTQSLTDFAVSAFAVIGEDYFCLKANKTFGLLRNTGEFEELLTDVDRFCNAGKVIVQKKSNLYMVDASGIISVPCEQEIGKLVGFDGQNSYVLVDEAVYLLNCDADNTAGPARVLRLNQSEVLKALCYSDKYEMKKAMVYSMESEPYQITEKQPISVNDGHLQIS